MTNLLLSDVPYNLLSTMHKLRMQILFLYDYCYVTKIFPAQHLPRGQLYLLVLSGRKLLLHPQKVVRAKCSQTIRGRAVHAGREGGGAAIKIFCTTKLALPANVQNQRHLWQKKMYKGAPGVPAGGISLLGVLELDSSLVEGKFPNSFV